MIKVTYYNGGRYITATYTKATLIDWLNEPNCVEIEDLETGEILLNRW